MSKEPAPNSKASVFGRSAKVGPPSPFTPPRLVWASLHLGGIPAFRWFVSSGASTLLTYFGRPAFQLSPGRMDVLKNLNILYSVRWAVGGMLMGSQIDMGAAVHVSVGHAILHQCVPVALAMTTGATPLSVPYDMSVVDKAAVSGLIVGAILQHFSEFQRYLFKREASNTGKIHTGGLFAYARFINHTGHGLTDLCQAVLCRSALYFVFPFLVTMKNLVEGIAPETEEHMAKKYGAQWTNYLKKTPYKFIPGIW